jgi:DNA polymerase-3 subunit epsilon
VLARLIADRALAFLDLETTGVDTAEDRIVEIAIEVHYPATVDDPCPAPERKVRRLNPGVPIPAEATAIHGITDADVADAPLFGQVARSLATLLESCDVAGFNVRRFDLPLLVAEWKRAGVMFDAKRLPGGAPRRIIDLMMLFHLEQPRDLAAAVRCYAGAEHEGAHSAEADVGVLPDVLAGMLAQHEELAPDLGRLHARCDEYQPYRSETERWFGDDLEAPVFQFGKCKDLGLRDADNGYIGWMFKQSDIHDEVKQFVREFLRRGVAV